MKDVTIVLPDRPGALADLGEALGQAGISIEGGGAFATGAGGLAHFLFDDGAAAQAALEAAGIRVLAVRDVVTHRLSQALPGQLGLATRRVARAGVNIDAMYSDHDNRLVLVVDDPEKARAALAVRAAADAP